MSTIIIRNLGIMLILFYLGTKLFGQHRPYHLFNKFCIESKTNLNYLSNFKKLKYLLHQTNKMIIIFLL